MKIPNSGGTFPLLHNLLEWGKASQGSHEGSWFLRAVWSPVLRPCEGLLWACSYERLMLVTTAAWLKTGKSYSTWRRWMCTNWPRKTGWNRMVSCITLSILQGYSLQLVEQVAWVRPLAFHPVMAKGWDNIILMIPQFHKGHWSSPGHFFLQKAPQPP